MTVWGVWFYSAGTILVLLLSIPLCSRAEEILGKHDPNCIVVDEWVGMMIALWPLCLAGSTFAAGVAGLILFRLFDILKPLGISRLQSLPGGYGVVLDDAAAGLAAALVLSVGLTFAG